MIGYFFVCVKCDCVSLATAVSNERISYALSSCGFIFRAHNQPKISLQYTRPYPEIIGEGDVVSVVLPDGNLQFFFTPTANWWTPVAGPPLANGNSHWNANAGVWFVRTISNPLQPQLAFNQQQNQRNFGDPLLRPFINSECNISPLGYNLKFHDDHWTSTTDLQYFYPCLRRDWSPRILSKGSAAVQVELLSGTNTIYHQDVICNRSCHCITKTEVKHTKRACKCNDIVDTSSNMSVEDTKPKSRQKVKERSKEGKKSSNSSECDDKTEPNCTDKSVTTYTDQASGCTSEEGRETQTCDNASPVRCANSVPSYEGKLEIWTPKTEYSKKLMKTQRSQESGHVSDSCDNCSCWSD